MGAWRDLARLGWRRINAEGACLEAREKGTMPEFGGKKDAEDKIDKTQMRDDVLVEEKGAK